MTDADGTPHSVSPELLDQLATEFEQYWRNGNQPRIEEYLNRVEEKLRPSLFRELIQVELELRKGEGKHSSLEEYRDRFPAYADVLKEIPIQQPESEAVGVNVFEQIQSICRDFQRQLKQGAFCRIEDYVGRVKGEAQSNLFQQLLSAEITSRLQKGEQPSSDEYIARFPHYRRLIRRAFLEPSLMSGESGESGDSIDASPANVPTMITEVPVGERLGDYELMRELGRGGMGVVYEARHTDRNDRVALKTLPVSVDGQPHPLKDADRLHKFRREFRSLAEINHPHLVGMQTLEVAGDQWFFTMDLIDGGNFLEHVRPQGQLNEERLRAVLPQLVRGISALHAQQIVHRDLKPTNVMVDQDGRVVILDFGLVAELQERLEDTVSMRSGQFAGTLRYAAPEQLSGQRPAAADWYALGVMIYEALTGEPPFFGTQADLIVQKQTLDAPKLTGREDVPQDLAVLVDQLLQRDPAKRPDETSIASTLSTDLESSTSDSTDSEHSFDYRPEEVTLIGRETQLAQLEEAKQEWLAGDQPVVVFVSGKSGEGKSSLAEKFLSSLRNGDDVVVLSGRCYDRESVPYKAIDGIVDALVGHLRTLGEGTVAGMLPEDTDMLAQLFPVTRRVEAIAQLDLTLVRSLDAKQVRNRAFSALKQFLERISRETPLVVFIDDLQWGDRDSGEALFELLSAADAPAVLFLGNYRSDEAEGSPFLQTWKQLTGNGQATFSRPPIHVGPLTEPQCVALVVNRVGMDTPTIRAGAVDLCKSTSGNPYLLEQSIDRYTLENGSFCPAPLDEVLDGRLQKLPFDAAPLLETIAVAGQALRLDEAAQAAGVKDAAFEIICHMRSERLVRLIGADDRQLVNTYHDKIRETVLNRMERDVQKNLLRRLGETVEKLERTSADERLRALEAGADKVTVPARVFDLAYYFEQAGDEKKALLYALLAAEQAKGQYALDIALEKYRATEQYVQSVASSLKYRIKTGYGETLLLAGEYELADGMFQQALACASNQRERLTVKVHQADILNKTKSLAESISTTESLLQELGVRVPHGKTRVIANIIIQRLYQAYRTIVDRVFPPRQSPDWKVLLRLKLLQVLIHSHTFRSPHDDCWAILAAFNIARKYPTSAELSVFYSYRGFLTTVFPGWPSEVGLNHMQRAVTIAENSKNDTLLANALFFKQFGLEGTGNFPSALENCIRSFELYCKVGDAWRQVFARWAMAWINTYLGNSASAIRLSHESFDAAIQFGQPRLAQLALATWSMSSRGSLPFNELRSCCPETPDEFVTDINLSVAESIWHRKQGRTEKSLNTAQRAVDLIIRDWVIHVFTTQAIPNLAESMRIHSGAIHPTAPVESRKLRKRGLRVARWAVRIGRFQRTDLSYSFRELSLAYASFDKFKKAYKYAVKSLQVAEEQGASRQYAVSLLVCGQLGEKLRKPDYRQQIAEAEAKLTEFDRQIEEANQKAMEQLGLSDSMNSTEEEDAPS